MNVAIIGARGQLGRELVRVFGPGCIPLDIGEVDLCEPVGLRRALYACGPDIVINTAAFHNVPECEKNPARAFATNAVGVKNLRDACLGIGSGLVQVSTDYVFDGAKGAPYTEEDAPDPVNTYGVSKLAGEFFARQVPAHHVVRLSSLFGIAGSVGKGGTNFVKLMLDAARTKDRIAVSSNIVSSPTYAVDAAVRIREIVVSGAPPGIYHVSNAGECSWHDFAAEIFRRTGASIRLETRIETPELEGGLRRPLNTALRSLRMPPLRPWQEALEDYLREEGALRPAPGK
jgi:dTDP-4-dehydrorhamnose reductase